MRLRCGEGLEHEGGRPSSAPRDMSVPSIQRTEGHVRPRLRILGAPERNVVAGFAHVSGDETAALQEGENGAAQAEPGERLKGRCGYQHGKQDPRRRREAGSQQHRGRRRHGGADALREALWRTGNEASPPEPGRQDLDRELGQGRDRGPNSTRSQNPVAMMASPQPKPVSRVTAESATTRAAVMRAAYSFTGFGNANTLRQSMPRFDGTDFDCTDFDGSDFKGSAGVCASVGLLIRQGYERARCGGNDCCAM